MNSDILFWWICIETSWKTCDVITCECYKATWCVPDMIGYVACFQVHFSRAKIYLTGGRCAVVYGSCSCWQCSVTVPSSSCSSSRVARWTCHVSSCVTLPWLTSSWASTSVSSFCTALLAPVRTYHVSKYFIVSYHERKGQKYSKW
jgi:hypothetical protein